MPPEPSGPPPRRSPDPLAARAATAVLEAFDAWHDRFRDITRRARARFERRDWHGAQSDAEERLLLYPDDVAAAVERVRTLLGPAGREAAVWARAKAEYAERTANRADCEIARTFFNSVSRRVLDTVGVEAAAEFLGFELDGPEGWGGLSPYLAYEAGADTAVALRRILRDLPLDAPFADLDGDARLAAEWLDRDADAPAAPAGEARGRADAERSEPVYEILPSPFYRNKGAYLVGRIRRGASLAPLVLALLHDEDGVRLDAVLTTSDEASIVFGFSRSYFHVDLRRPRAAVDFLASILPRKRIDELYTSIGYERHGKSELYRALRQHLTRPGARFVPAEGERGMVMSVFTLPSLNVVFKVIRDRFAPEKRVTRSRVKNRYRLVYVRDRVGRLADAQEFEALELGAGLFAPEVLEELLRDCPSTVSRDGDRVVIEHLYTVRRMTPLDLHLRRAPREEALEALLDYGRAIKDLAAANVFPGDMLFKNFGVTRHGRVVFYDYDELILLTECTFREIPEPVHPEDELARGAWFHVGDRDIFPEEFSRFLAFPDGMREPFLAEHGDLMDVEFWRDMQARQEAGEVMDFFPYRPSRRLRPVGPG